jgi:S-disulfanyl-L-cysteine oxidoreductase SoxD
MRQYCWLLMLLGLTGCQDTLPDYPRRTPPADYQSAASVKEGEKLFMQLCASCHGDTGEGRSPRADFFSPPAPDFKSPYYARVDPSYLHWRIAKGKTVEPFLSRGSVMPTWGDHFSQQQLWSLVAYLQSRSQ